MGQRERLWEKGRESEKDREMRGSALRLEDKIEWQIYRMNVRNACSTWATSFGKTAYKPVPAWPSVMNLCLLGPMMECVYLSDENLHQNSRLQTWETMRSLILRQSDVQPWQLVALKTGRQMGCIWELTPFASNETHCKILDVRSVPHMISC